VKQYGVLFEMEGVELDIRADALQSIADKALARKTGARGLRSILESVLLDIMYDIPSRNNVSKVVIDSAVVRGEAEPLVVYASSDQTKAKVKVASDDK